MLVTYRSNPAYVLASYALLMGAKPEEIAAAVAEMAAYCDESGSQNDLSGLQHDGPGGIYEWIGFDPSAEYAAEMREREAEIARWQDDGGHHFPA